jgi:hypothetical protein
MLVTRLLAGRVELVTGVGLPDEDHRGRQRQRQQQSGDDGAQTDAPAPGARRLGSRDVGLGSTVVGGGGAVLVVGLPVRHRRRRALLVVGIAHLVEHVGGGRSSAHHFSTRNISWASAPA